MGFLEYAYALSMQKDNLKARILLKLGLQRPILVQDDAGYIVTVPEPSVSVNGTIAFLESEFPADLSGKAQVGRFFRACVSHLTAHTLVPNYKQKSRHKTLEHATLEAFVDSLVEDVYVNVYISAEHADRLFDVAYANSMAFSRLKSTEKIFNPATRLMAALLTKLNVGITKGTLSAEEETTLDKALLTLNLLRKKIALGQAEEENGLSEAMEKTADDLIQYLGRYGPIVETPSLPYTEQIGPCKTFTEFSESSEPEIQRVFWKSLETLSGASSSGRSLESCWNRQYDEEIIQAFDTTLHQKTREERILVRLRECAGSSRFKTIKFAEEDYTQYLRSRNLVSGGSRRLLDSLRVAQDALDEDPGKEFGQLDLTAVINAISSKKPATDVFMRDEYLSRSFAWGLLFDSSQSMRIRGEFARALAICVAEATKELLMDPGSWTFFAFSDCFYVLKDASEPYSSRVRARLGGLRFGGLTYLPDAIQVAGEMLNKRYDEQKFLIVISDGVPCGYPNIHEAVSQAIDSLQKRDVIVIGIGVETDRIKDLFKLGVSVHSQKDLIKGFSTIFLKASASKLEA